MTKEAASELKNARAFPKIFYCRHMQPGVAGYENETILVNADAMKAMIPSFVGKPIYVHHQDVDLDTLKEEAAGYVADSFYNELDGWAWVKMLVIDDEAIDRITSGWAVSNAYVPTDWAAGGTEHNVKYDRAINTADFTHLAIVPNPRYEQAKVYSPEEFKSYQEGKRQQLNELKNAKEDKKGVKTVGLKFWNTKKEEAAEVTPETLVEIQNDDGSTSEVKVADMISAVQNAKAKKNEDDEGAKEEAKGDKENGKAKLNEDSKVSVGDEEMTLGELMNRYRKANEADDKGDKEKANGDDEGAKEEEKGDKENRNSKENFDELRNANKKGSEAVVTIDTESNKLARGQSRYGSQAK